MVDNELDSGVATVFVCLAVALLLAVSAVGIHLGGAVLTRQQAETAADLGALAGAARMLQGVDAACTRAGELVALNRGFMTTCRADGLDLLIEVEVPVPAWGGVATAKARAGPVRTP